MFHLFYFLVFPLVAILLLCLAKNTDKQRLKDLAVFLSCVPLLMLLVHFVGIGAHLKYQWFSHLNIFFHLEIDALSLIFLYLTNIIIPISILAIPKENIKNPLSFYALILVLQFFLMAFFMAQDLLVFTLFWEAMLLPLYFMITLWGKNKRASTAFLFLIYMIAGSFLLMIGVLSLYFMANSLNITQIAEVAETHAYAKWVLLIFLLAFAVKTPLFPFHAWLPDTYANAPIAGTILLSALLSKAGIYGILRVGFGIFPAAMEEWNWILIPLATVGIFYGGFAAWKQEDFKRLIAYSSFSHVNLILAGLFIATTYSYTGAILQAVNHSLTITALFLVAGWLEERLNTTEMSVAGRLATYFPILCWMTLFFVLSNVGLPGLNNFVGEFLVFFGAFTYHPWLAGVLCLSIIVSVIYMLRFMQKIYFGVPNSYQPTWRDVGKKEIFIALPLILLILWIGVYPESILKQIESVRNSDTTGSVDHEF